MPPSPSAQLDLTRRYARELRRLQGEARHAFGRSEATLRKAAKDLSQGLIPGQERSEEPVTAAEETETPVKPAA